MLAASDITFVVDDDAAVRNALKFSLEIEGLSVRLFADGPSLLESCADTAAGCIVIDYAMPIMNGLEVIVALRRRQVDLPVILIASEVTEDLRRRAARARVAHVLEKPLSDGMLLDCIRSVMS
jgi:FixJ family two-component response regulator